MTARTAPIRLVLSTEAEMKIQGIWAKVLGLPQEGIVEHDVFFCFYLGGDSLLIMELVQQVQRLGSKTKATNVFS